MTNEEKFSMLEKLEKEKKYISLVKKLEKEIGKIEENIWENKNNNTKTKIDKSRNDVEYIYFETLVDFCLALKEIENSEVLIEAIEERADIVKNNIISATKPYNDSIIDISRDNLEFSINDLDRYKRKYIKMNISMLEYLKGLYGKKETKVEEEIY